MADLRALIALPLALAIAGCIPQPMEGATVPPPAPAPASRPAPPAAPNPAPAPVAPPAETAGTCEAAKGYALIGEIRSEALGTRALALTGARSLRWIRPGDAVTMDFRQDRLNIDLDTQGRVVGMKCG